MNVAMPTATAVLHRRAGDSAMEASADRSATRATRLVRAIMPERQPALIPCVDGLLASVRRARSPAGAGAAAASSYSSWDAFLQRWGYDEEQLLAIERALRACCP